MATQRDVEKVTHYSSQGPSTSRSAQRGYVNSFFCDIIPEQHSNRRIPRKSIQAASRGQRFLMFNSFMPRRFLIFCLVLRAENIPSIKKYRFLNSKLFVTVSNPEKTVKNADVPAVVVLRETYYCNIILYSIRSIPITLGKLDIRSIIGIISDPTMINHSHIE